MKIDEFIDKVAPKLAMPVRPAWEKMKGSELRLTGYKEVRGKPIEDHKIYTIPAPYSVKVDHNKKLRLAWLRGGKLAVKTYLAKFLKKDELQKVMKVL